MRMITGYNTDVRHQDTVFHVQTEDKGEGNPYIESLVYVGGQVLASRRTEYRDLLDSGEGGKAVLARMEKQHRAMIAAIRRGKLDERIAAMLGTSATPPEAVVATGVVPEPGAAVAPMASGDATIGPAATGSVSSGARPVLETGPQPTTGGGDERTLDQVILDYLSSEAEQEHLELQVTGDPEVRVGARAHLELQAVSSRTRTPVSTAQIVVRMISTVAEPRTLTSGITDGDGKLSLEFNVPDLGRGTMALIISGSCELGRAELKQLL